MEKIPLMEKLGENMSENQSKYSNNASFLNIAVREDKVSFSPLDRIKQEDEDSYLWKIKKLREIVNRAMPEGSTMFSSSVITAISELNKMEGHYAPEKSITFSASADLELKQAQKLLEKVAENKKDY